MLQNAGLTPQTEGEDDLFYLIRIKRFSKNFQHRFASPGLPEQGYQHHMEIGVGREFGRIGVFDAVFSERLARLRTGYLKGCRSGFMQAQV